MDDRLRQLRSRLDDAIDSLEKGLLGEMANEYVLTHWFVVTIHQSPGQPDDVLVGIRRSDGTSEFVLRGIVEHVRDVLSARNMSPVFFDGEDGD